MVSDLVRPFYLSKKPVGQAVFAACRDVECTHADRQQRLPVLRASLRALLPLLLVTALHAQDPAFMPVPATIVRRPGRLVIDRSFRVALTGQQDASVRASATRLISRLAKQTGLPLTSEIDADAVHATLVIQCDRARKVVQAWNEDESYRLAISPEQARLNAPTPLGALRGMETFLQAVVSNAASAAVINDRPRFAWRGLHIDVARHWMPLEVILRNLDGMAAVKLNVLHWHLTDDQGFRIESKKYPKLAGMGSDGDFYTQDQVREVIAYARERGIRVLPEFDIPGHATSWFVGYPELASAPGPYAIERTWGILPACMDPTRESTFQFLDGFIAEMAALFPDEYFHIGGDEVNGIQWNASPQVEAYKREQGLKDNHALQAYFNRRLQAIVSKHGKRMEGWDEILDPDLPKNIVIQSWRGQKSLAQAARLGYSGILSSGYYLDLIYPASAHYAVDPLGKQAATLPLEQKKRILGGEGCMWSEYVSPANIDSRIWPRMAAIAERLWSPKSVTDVDSMYRRLDVMSGRLEALGLTHRSSYLVMLRRLAGAEPVEPLQTLADVVEPVKEYARGNFQHYTQQTPLNRLVDTARPESTVARNVSKLADQPRENADALRKWFTVWRENAAKLKPVIDHSELLKEVEPLSSDLSRLGAIGLQALDYQASGTRPPDAWLKEQLAFLESAKQPRAEVLLMVVAPVEKLLTK